MNHLTDEQMVLLLYGEVESQNAVDNQHLRQCHECRERFQLLRNVQESLNSFEVEQPNWHVDVQAILDQDQATFESSTADRRSLPKRLPMAGIAIAASLFVLVGGMSFLSGVRWQSQQTSALVQEQVTKAILEIRNHNRETKGQLNQDLMDQFEDQLTALQQSLSEQDANIAAQNLSALKGIDSRVSALLVAHDSLRRDLQTLAVNAEDEISLAQNDIRRINEFVSILLPSVNQN